VAAALAGPRSTVRLLASLPLLGLLLGTVIGANPLAFLGGSTTGVSCLATAIALDVTGVWWSARIAHRAAQIG
ncbi:MAG: tight adherence protein, partial [Actinomycetota bacterium]|nr:tight adherence protein [Actinomycetota bacterium]